jgi:hypothetical protein
MRWTNDQPSLHYPTSRSRRIATDYIRPIPTFHRSHIVGSAMCDYHGTRPTHHVIAHQERNGAVLEIMPRGFPSFAARCGKGGLTTGSSGGNNDLSNPGEPPSDEPEFCCAHDRYRNYADSYSWSPLARGGRQSCRPKKRQNEIDWVQRQQRSSGPSRLVDFYVLVPSRDDLLRWTRFAPRKPYIPTLCHFTYDGEPDGPTT